MLTLQSNKLVSTDYFKTVRKRDGRLVVFDRSFITRAIMKAMAATGEGGEEDAIRVSDQALIVLKKKYPKDYVLGIEEIQDIVEESLILLDYAKTVKAYIIYRQKRLEIRTKSKEVPERIKKLVEESKKYFRNPLGEFIYYRTYSRWIEEENRRETWIETVDRYVSFMKENLGEKLTDVEYQEIKEAILNQRVMPSMRLLWGAGKAARKNNVCAYNCSYIAPSKIDDFAEIMFLLMNGTGVGFSVEHQTTQMFPQIKKQTGELLPTFVIEDSKEGWGDSLTAGLNAWFEGKDVNFDFSKIRPEGSHLKTMGGKASGPGPLKNLLEFSRRKILARQGKRLRPIDVHDIICKIGEIVVMGGVRRSALISLSDLDDETMRTAKMGQFYLTEPQRSLANNSVAYNEKPSADEFLEEWLSLIKSNAGERGIFNRGGLKKQMPERRWKILGKDAATVGTNPCVTDDIWVMTSEGARQVKELIGRPFEALVHGRAFSSSGFFKTGEKEVFEIKTARGFFFQSTANHRVRVVDYRSRKVERQSWKEVRDIVPGDRIVLHRHNDVEWNGAGTEAEGWLLGNLLGDGNIEKNGKANLDYWGVTQEVMINRAVALVHQTVRARNDLVGYRAKTGYARVSSTGLGSLAEKFGIRYDNKVVTDEIEKSSSDFYRGFLRGWFDADGSVQGTQQKGVSVRLSSNSLLNLERAQRMLARIGIISTLYKNRRLASLRSLPDGKGGAKQYFCKANHDLIITGKNLEIFAKRVNFSDPDKEKTLRVIFEKYSRALNRETFDAEVSEITPAGVMPVYDCAVRDVHAFDGNSIILHNCGEIYLKSKEFCNLTEVVARAEDTEESLLEKIRLAVILGTYQSTFTNFSYLSEEWKKNCEEERLLGVSITGQWDCPALRNAEIFHKLKEKAVEVNKIYAGKFNINPSAAITCVKPSGTVSQLVDASSGMHPRHSRYYIRRVRIASTDNLFQMLKEQRVSYRPEVGQSMGSASTYVLEFPVKAPDGSIFKNDMSAIEQLEYWKLVKENYTEHNPSVTVSVGKDEWVKVGNWVYDNWDNIGGLSFLPREDSDRVYPLAPYEEIDEKKYNEMVAAFPEIDFSQIIAYEGEDGTQGAKELACVSGVCEI